MAWRWKQKEKLMGFLVSGNVSKSCIIGKLSWRHSEPCQVNNDTSACYTRIRLIIHSLEVRRSEINELERVSAIEIYTPYTQVTDTFDNLPISKGDIKDDAIVTFKAKRSHSIKGMIGELYNIFTNKQKDKIGRIRVYGKTVSQSDILLDTNKLKDHDIIKVEIDENNQVTTASILPAIKELVKEVL